LLIQVLADALALRQALQSNPAMLEQMINDLSQNYPELLEQLGSRENLAQMIQDPAVYAWFNFVDLLKPLV
jgi:hypothetical protein